ncbi:MAG: hypothetical protein CMG46_02680 [Candidatus Marinimicrobia bacterium]|nr:hypothetical protein [Candidatus Neomarinimicrobiota bacterium]|tara:strand:- start:1244 stop:1810 length:567 start_codon:yes stop_codon:yes gene_type:complete
MVDVLLNSLYKYYRDEQNLKSLLDIIETNSKVSLRIIDWFVTNYSKKFNIFYCIYCNQDGKNTFDKEGNYIHKHFNTYQSYKSQLKSYSKKKFDPFCRRQRIEFEYKEGQKIETTVGQLNFFKWAIENLIIDYILLHYSEIEQDMNQSYNQIKKHKKKSNERKKRQELSKSATRGLNNTNMKVILDFN